MKLRFRIATLLLLTAFTSCSSGNSASSSQDLEIIEKQAISLVDFFEQEEDDYLVFAHSDTCSQCQEILGDVASFAQDNIKKTYFLNVGKTENKITKVPVSDITVGIDNINDLVYAGTPTIFEIEKGVTTVNIPGKDKCLTFLNELRKNNLE